MKKGINKIHDKFFKSSMKNDRVARQFFQSYIPHEILCKTDLTTITVEDNSFIDDDFSETEADVVFSAQVNQQLGYFYILCEHQSSVDKSLALRMRKYMLRIVERYRHQQPDKALPFVYPLIVYTGKDRYTGKTDFFELFAKQPFDIKYYWNQPIRLIDVHRMDDTVIAKHDWLGLSEYVFKYRQSPNFSEAVLILFPWLERIEQQGGSKFVKLVIRYVFDGMESAEEQLFIKKAREYSQSKLGGEVMTLTEQIMARGVQQGKQIIAQNLLAEGMAVTRVVQVTGLSFNEVTKMNESITV